MKHTNARGTNKYQIKHKGLSKDAIKSIFNITFTVIAIVALIQWYRYGVRLNYYHWRDTSVLAPCGNFCTMDIPVAMAYEDNTPTLSNITAYVIKKFEPEGRNVAVRALACFISESGLRADAYNGSNSNGTSDYGVAQVNTVHLKRFGNDFTTNWKSNVDVAFKIYKERGWSAWYGKYCN